MVGSWYVIHSAKVVLFRRELKKAIKTLGTLSHLKRLTIDWIGFFVGEWDFLKRKLIKNTSETYNIVIEGTQGQDHSDENGCCRLLDPDQ